MGRRIKISLFLWIFLLLWTFLILWLPLRSYSGVSNKNGIHAKKGVATEEELTTEAVVAPHIKKKWRVFYNRNEFLKIQLLANLQIREI